MSIWQILSPSVAIMFLLFNGDSVPVRKRKVLNISLVALSALFLAQSPAALAVDTIAPGSSVSETEDSKKDRQKKKNAPTFFQIKKVQP